MTNTETGLTPISQAQRMLAEAKTLPELTDLRDYATTAKAWAKARGMGIEDENTATEVILRAEREIGRLMPDPKQVMTERASMRKAAGNQYMESRPREQAQPDGLTLLPTIAELGFSQKVAWQFKQLASIPDERFEAMVASVRAIDGARLAKANFYSAIEKAERKRSGADAARPTQSDPDFDLFRRGAFGLLGWNVDEDGAAGPTKNGLLALPDDQLRQFADIVRALAVAYGEVRNARA